MRRIRYAAIALLASIIAGAASIASSEQAVVGVGTAGVSTTVLEVKLGDLLGINVLGDSATATIDPANGAPSAVTKLTALGVTSPLAGLNHSISYEANSNAQPSTPVLPTAKGSFPTPSAVLAGTIDPGLLSAIVDANGARSGLSASISDVSLAGGLASVSSLSSKFGASAGARAVSAERTINVGTIKVLDLGALLAGLGIDLDDLSLPTVSQLVELLDTTVATLPAGKTVTEQVTLVRSAVNALQSTVNGITGTAGTVTAQGHELGHIDLTVIPDAPVTVPTTTPPVTTAPVTTPVGTVPSVSVPTLTLNDPVLDQVQPVVDIPTAVLDGAISTVLSIPEIKALQDALNGLLSSLGLPPLVGTTTVEQLLNLITTLKQSLTTLLGDALEALDDQALLTVEGLELSLATSASATLDDTTHVVKATIGAVRVGNLAALPAVDLLSGAGAVNELVSTINGTITSVLGAVSPGLAGVVKVEALAKDEGKKTENGYHSSFASVTALRATVTPPTAAELTKIIGELAPLTSIHELLDTAKVALPQLSTAMMLLESTLGPVLSSLTGQGVRAASAHGAVLGALTKGATITVGQMSSTSSFSPAPAPTTQTTLGAPGTPTGGPQAPGSPGTNGSPADPAWPTLPRTGADTLQLMAIGAFLIALGLAIPTWHQELRRS